MSPNVTCPCIVYALYGFFFGRLKFGIEFSFQDETHDYLLYYLNSAFCTICMYTHLHLHSYLGAFRRYFYPKRHTSTFFRRETYMYCIYRHLTYLNCFNTFCQLQYILSASIHFDLLFSHRIPWNQKRPHLVAKHLLDRWHTWNRKQQTLERKNKIKKKFLYKVIHLMERLSRPITS